MSVIEMAYQKVVRYIKKIIKMVKSVSLFFSWGFWSFLIGFPYLEARTNEGENRRETQRLNYIASATLQRSWLN